MRNFETQIDCFYHNVRLFICSSVEIHRAKSDSKIPGNSKTLCNKRNNILQRYTLVAASDMLP